MKQNLFKNGIMVSMILLLTLSLAGAASAQDVTNSGAITPNTVMTLQSENPSSSGWLSFQKDVWNTGVTADRAPILDPMQFPLSWEYHFSFGGYAGIDVNPVVSADKVYVVGANNHVYAFNRTTGTLLWEKSTSGSSFQLGTPAVGNGLLFVPTTDGNIYTFDAENGSEKWNKTLSSKQLDTPVLYSGDKIYFGEAMGGHTYYCLNATTGDEIWNRTATTQISGQGSYYWAGAALIGDSLVYGDDDGHLVSVNKDTGTDITEINVSTEFGVTSGEIRSSVLYVEDLERIYFTSKGGYCYGLGFNPAAGTFNLSEKYIASVGYTTSTPAYYNDRIYIGAGGMYGGGDGVSCLDADLTNEIWHYADGAVQSSPVLSTYYDDGDGEVYIYFTVNDYRGGVVCLRDYTGCTEPTYVWDFCDSSKTGYTLQGVAISDGWIYYGTDSKYLFGLTAPDPDDLPDARFEANVTSGQSPLTVQFTDLSTNAPTTWEWNFDEDWMVDSTEQNPEFTYNYGGTYTVRLSVSNSLGSDDEVMVDYITVTEPVFDNFTYVLNGTSVTITGYVGPDGDIVIPGTIEGLPVTRIHLRAFRDSTAPTSITIPDSVTSIGEAAFYGCPNLVSVTFGNGLTDIGSSTFQGCPNLTSVTIPESVTSIPDSMFSGCTGLTSVTIPENVTSIGQSVFTRCTSLTSVTIPDSVTSMGDNVFHSCTALTSVTIGNGVTTIPGYAFYRCNLSSVVIGNNVTGIGSYAFRDCNNLTSVTIPDSLTNIESRAFYNCGLTSVSIPDSVTSLGVYAFYGCNNLGSALIGNGVTSISDYAFQNCNNLTSVTIGNNVTIIGSYAFRDCTNLAPIVIPDSVTGIGRYAFRDCTNLTSMVFMGNAPTMGSSWARNCIILSCTTSRALQASLRRHGRVFRAIRCCLCFPSSLTKQ